MTQCMLTPHILHFFVRETRSTPGYRDIQNMKRLNSIEDRIPSCICN